MSEKNRVFVPPQLCRSRFDTSVAVSPIPDVYLAITWLKKLYMWNWGVLPGRKTRFLFKFLLLYNTFLCILSEWQTMAPLRCTEYGKGELRSRLIVLFNCLNVPCFSLSLAKESGLESSSLLDQPLDHCHLRPDFYQHHQHWLGHFTHQ